MIGKCPDLVNPGGDPRPPLEVESVEDYEERVATIAQLREECDAMSIENAEYESVLVVLQERIARNRDRIAVKSVAIGRLRSGRG